MLMHENEPLISTIHHDHNWEEDKDHVWGFLDTENWVFIGEVVIMKHLFFTHHYIQVVLQQFDLFAKEKTKNNQISGFLKM